MARTRSKPAAKDDDSKPSTTPSSTAKYVLQSHQGKDPVAFILPKNISKESKIVTLPHPRHGKPSRYLVCPETGIYEFTQITAPKGASRSWLMETARLTKGDDGSEKKEEEVKGSVISNGALYTATTIDPVFLILPALMETKGDKGSDEKKRMFLTSDDHFDKLPEMYSHLSEILRTPSTRKLFEKRMAKVCDTVDAGDESMFRLNEEKLLQVMLAKAWRMCEGGLPPSMEEKFVTKELEAPMLLQRSVAVAVVEKSEDEGGVSTPATESAESQVTVMTETSSISAASTAPTSIAGDTEETPAAGLRATPEITDLQRLRTAFDFITSSYISPPYRKHLQTLFTTTSGNGSSSTDFKPLDDYLAQLAKLKAETAASRSQSDFSRKRARDEDEDAAREEKKRKVEEEKKKKASQSVGVKKLAKVNTSGMMKLSSFFQKKA